MSRWIRIVLAAALALGLVSAVGCGETKLDDLKEGEVFEMGELRYNVLFTRFLNAGDVEDQGYLAGQPPPPGGKQYLAVFVLVENQSGDQQILPGRSDLKVADTTGVEYEPLDAGNEFSFPFASVIEGDSKVPDPDSVAASGPIQGSMLLYLVDEGVSSSRPLELSITSQGEEAVVELDL